MPRQHFCTLSAWPQLEWSPDCRALAVGYGGQGVVVWSPSGCRLMCSLRQPGPSLSTAPSSASRLGSLISHQPSLRAMLNRQSLDPAGSVGSMMLSPAASGLPAAVAARLGGTAGAGSSGPVAPLDGSVTALCWGPMGYQLAVAEVGGGGAGGSLAEVLFAHSLPHHHRVVYSGAGVATGAGDEIHVLQVGGGLLRQRGRVWCTDVVAWQTCKTSVIRSHRGRPLFMHGAHPVVQALGIACSHQVAGTLDSGHHGL